MSISQAVYEAQLQMIASLQARLANREAEIAKNGRHAMRVTIAQLEARLAEAEASNERLGAIIDSRLSTDEQNERDAARYRWLREHTVHSGLESFVGQHDVQFLDAAVDAAMTADSASKGHNPLVKPEKSTVKIYRLQSKRDKYQYADFDARLWDLIVVPAEPQGDAP